MSNDDYLALSGIQHYYYCPRQWALIHMEQQWEDNTRTFGGTLMHEKADDPYVKESRGTSLISRSMPLVSNKLKIRGIADVVEFQKNRENTDGIAIQHKRGKWRVYPVEYKFGEPKTDERDFLQLCAQAICLEEMFETEINSGYIYYGKIRRRVEVIFDTKLRAKVVQTVIEMQKCFESGKTPLGDKGNECRSCSLKNICIPKLKKNHLKVKQYIKNSIRER